MRKLAVFACLAVILWGCMSSPAKKYYQINLGEMERESLPTINKTVLVEPAVADGLYDDFRIIYRISPFELNYYSYEFWAEKPGKLIGDAISHFLIKNRVFAKVTRELSKGDPDILLRSRVHLIEEVDSKEAWFARLAMDLEFVDFKTGNSLLSHHFDRTEKLPEKNISEVPVVLSRILTEELTKILTDLSSQLSSRLR